MQARDDHGGEWTGDVWKAIAELRVETIDLDIKVVDTDYGCGIIRRGTNYLICVTESGQMFKSWIKDLREYSEVKMDKAYRQPGKPNTLVGTLGYFKYAAKQTPGAIGTGKENLQKGGRAYGLNFINKYRKNKK